MESRILKVIAADTLAADRLSLRFLLDRLPGVKCVGQCANAGEVFAQAARLRPALAFLEALLPDLTGFECARQLLTLAPCTKAIMVTGVLDAGAAEAARLAGAAGYLLKPTKMEEMKEAITSALEGRFFGTPEVLSLTAGSTSLIDPGLSFPKRLCRN